LLANTRLRRGCGRRDAYSGGGSQCTILEERVVWGVLKLGRSVTFDGTALYDSRLELLICSVLIVWTSASIANNGCLNH
jgi:hypothetical protein